MTTVSDMLFHLGGVPVVGGLIPFGGSSVAYFVDPANGSASNDGRTPETAFASVATAYARTVSGQNDVIFFIGGATGDTLSEALTWSNSYTHLVGLSSPLPGVGQRCRVLGGATTDLTNVITVSGTGCIFINLQIANWADADADANALTVSGNRNAFINCMISGMGHATPAARAGSASLTVSGSENTFRNCYIGLDTIVRAAANAELVMSGSKNSFWDCEFSSYSETAGKFLVTVSGAGTNYWKRCLFHNMSVNWVNTLTDVFNVTASSTHYIILDPFCQSVGFTGWGNTVTHIYGSGPAPNAGYGISVNPTG